MTVAQSGGRCSACLLVYNQIRRTNVKFQFLFDFDKISSDDIPVDSTVAVQSLFDNLSTYFQRGKFCLATALPSNVKLPLGELLRKAQEHLNQASIMVSNRLTQAKDTTCRIC